MATALEKWVDEQAQLFEPKHVYWSDGSEGEARRIIEMGMKEERIGQHDIFCELNRARWPEAYLHRSHPTDVARTDVRSGMIRSLLRWAIRLENLLREALKKQIHAF